MADRRPSFTDQRLFSDFSSRLAVQFFINLPIEVRLTLLFLFGTVVGGQINRGIYRLAWDKRLIGPWSQPHEKAPSRKWLDRTPVLGWIALRRESVVHGDGFWLRPMCIELFTGSGFAALYWWEVIEMGLLPDLPRLMLPSVEVLHSQYILHIVLFSVMLVATFIDFDEKTIPDAITVPGTIFALVFVSMMPTALLPFVITRPPPPMVDSLLVSSPNPWPVWLDGTKGLYLALSIIFVWSSAIMQKTWTTRYGLVKAVMYALASIRRYRTWIIPAVVLLVSGGLTISVWRIGDIHWRAVCSAIVGLAFGGGLIWAIRIVGAFALKKEAMGFGDVTLMAMIGAFLGWQPSLLVFFMAPLAALVISITHWIATGRRDIPFGPYLCFAAVIVIVAWDMLWHQWAVGWFGLGLYIPAILLVCLGFMTGMLMLWRIVEQLLFGSRDHDVDDDRDAPDTKSIYDTDAI